METISERLRRIQAEPKAPAPAPAGAQAKSPGSEDPRKARTRRLIQLGAITDQYMGTAELSTEETAALFHELVQLPEVQSIISNHQRPE